MALPGSRVAVTAEYCGRSWEDYPGDVGSAALAFAATDTPLARFLIAGLTQ